MSAGPLTHEEIIAYRRDGFVTPRRTLPSELIDAMRLEIEALMRANAGIRPEQLVGAHVPYSADTQVRGRDALLACARHPDLLDMVEQIIGPDIILWGSQVFSKPPETGMEIPWHQDGQYWPMRPLATVTVWIAIDPATVANGCLRVIPGSHCAGLLAHESSDRRDLALNQALVPGVIDEAAAVDVELAAGQVSLHDAMLVHGSRANRSGQRRCGYAIRYMPATSHFDRTLPPTRIARDQVVDFSRRPIWLVRGRDRAGNDFTVGHANAAGTPTVPA
jgi:hypothetical protein